MVRRNPGGNAVPPGSDATRSQGSPTATERRPSTHAAPSWHAVAMRSLSRPNRPRRTRPVRGGVRLAWQRRGPGGAPAGGVRAHGRMPWDRPRPRGRHRPARRRPRQPADVRRQRASRSRLRRPVSFAAGEPVVPVLEFERPEFLAARTTDDDAAQAIVPARPSPGRRDRHVEQPSEQPCLGRVSSQEQHKVPRPLPRNSADASPAVRPSSAAPPTGSLIQPGINPRMALNDHISHSRQASLRATERRGNPAQPTHIASSYIFGTALQVRIDLYPSRHRHVQDVLPVVALSRPASRTGTDRGHRIPYRYSRASWSSCSKAMPRAPSASVSAVAPRMSRQVSPAVSVGTASASTHAADSAR